MSLAAIGATEPRATLAEAVRTRRPVWFDGGWVDDTPVYRREHLPRSAAFDGPAIIEQLACTTVVKPGNRVTMDAIGNLIVTVRPGGAADRRTGPTAAAGPDLLRAPA